MRVYIVRHGETQENRDGIIQGQQDTSLNVIGLEQARMVGEALKDATLGVAFSSDLSRAVKVRGSNHIKNVNHIRSSGGRRIRPAHRSTVSQFAVSVRADACLPNRLLKRYSFIIQGSPCTSG